MTRKRPVFLAARDASLASLLTLHFKKRGAGHPSPSGYLQVSRHLLPGVQGAVWQDITEWTFREAGGRRSAWESTGQHYRGGVQGYPRWKAAWAGPGARGLARAGTGPGVRVQGVTGLCPPQGEMLDNIELNVMHTVGPLRRRLRRRPKRAITRVRPEGEPSHPQRTGPSCALSRCLLPLPRLFCLCCRHLGIRGKGAMIDRIENNNMDQSVLRGSGPWQTPKRRSSIRAASG